MTVFRRKFCVGCGLQKVVSRRNFYRCMTAADGYRNKCIECVKVDVYENRELKALHYRTYDRLRNRLPERRAFVSAWKRTPAGRESCQRSSRRYVRLKALEARA